MYVETRQGQFVERGGSSHPGAGAVLWVIEAWCRRQGIAVTVIPQASGGYVTTRDSR